MKICYDNCAIYYENCAIIIIIIITSRVGGIFRVGRVTPIQLFSFALLKGTVGEIIKIKFRNMYLSTKKTNNNMYVYYI